MSIASRRVIRLCAGLLAFTVFGGYAVASDNPTQAKPSVGSFGRGQAYFHHTRYAPYRFVNTLVRLHFDVARGIVYGDETAIVRPKRSKTSDLPFNTLDIHYKRITVNGKSAAYAFDARRQLVNVHLPSPAAADALLAVEFTYWAKPQRGVYFVQPDRAYPDVAPEIWSQGEPIDNRRWFPTWDEPNQKTPSELIVTVPRGWTVVANGYLKAHTHTSSADLWDWNAPKPKSTYLIAFAAGPLVEHHTALGTMKVDSYVQPQYAGLNALCFGRTKDAIAYFQRIIGEPFPWEKYDQTTAERYVFGGMEDASATLLTTRALHPSIEDVEQPCDVLVSHELAQQWWGDDATMSDWSNVWLHEGFATYFDELWSGQRFGQADFEFERYRAQQIYFQETRQYLRPIVDYVYASPLDLFDASSHQRPGEVLHMLRFMFGDARFFAALRTYLQHYAYKNVDTDQFFSSIGKSLGTDLTWFKNEWFYRSAYPHYYVSKTYDAAAHTLRLDVEQRNLDGKPFRMPVVIEAFFGGHVARIEPILDRNLQVVTIANVTSPPEMVLFDPNNNILRQLTFPKSVQELAYQLAHARHVGDREWALQQLIAMKTADGGTRAAAMLVVRHAASADPFYGVRSDAVDAATAFDDATAIEAALHDPDKRVRLAAEDAAGKLHGQPAAAIAALNAMSNDPDPNVSAGALTALGALRAPGAYDRLTAALQRRSFRQTIASGALRGLAAYGDARACALIKPRTAYGTAEQERNTAIVALAQLAGSVKEPQVALSLLEDIATRDPLISTRIAATKALGILGDDAALPALEYVERTDSQELVRNGAWDAVKAIRTHL